MKSSLRVLVVEDSEFDAQIMVSLLRKAGYEVNMRRVETATALRTALAGETWDVILADYNLPDFDAPGALRILQESGLDLPFLIVSGGIGEDVAVAAMKAGAHDYLMKGNLHRLAPAVERELREAAVRARERAANLALQESELRYRLLWQSCPDAVILMDPDGGIRYANPAVEAVFGYTPQELIGQGVSLLQPERSRSGHLSALGRYLETGIKQLNWRASEMLGLRKDGLEIPLEVSFSDMELNGRRHFVGFIRDITERKRAERELRDNQEQFRVATEIQQRLFPKSAPALPGYDLAGASYPAEATGGDYYDYLPMANGGLGIIVGDVTGHGVGPALLMAETRAYLRVLAGRRDDVGEILTRANSVLAEDIGQERFITLCLARLNTRQPSLAYASAGHPPCHILNQAGELKQQLPRTGVPLGLRPDTQYATSAEIPLAYGDIVLFMTDGIEETMAPDNSLFGVDRALEVVRANCSKSAQEIVDALYVAVKQFAANVPQLDDLTAIVVKVLPAE